MRIVKILVVGILFLGQFLFAQSIPYNQEFQVNTYVDDLQSNPNISFLADSGFVICWQSNGQDGDGSGIYGQMYNSDGSKYGNEFQINTYTESHQSLPSVCHLVNGGFVVCWVSLYQDGNGLGIYGQLFNSNGSKRGNEFRINTRIADMQSHPSISYLPEGGFVVCWESGGGQDGSDYGIFGQMYDSDGSKQNGEFQINTYTEDSQSKPTVSSLVDGGFVVCWNSDGQSGRFTHGAFGQLFESDGSKRGDEFQINIDIENHHQAPNVSFLTDEKFVICWLARSQNNSWSNITAQIYNYDGSKYGDEFIVSTNNEYLLGSPNICNLNDDGFVICWISYGSDDGIFIYGQLYSNNGLERGGVFQISRTQGLYFQRLYSVSHLLEGGFAVSWQSDEISAKYYIKEINHDLENFILEYPSNDETVYQNKAALLWQQASNIRINFPWELEYTVYLDEDENFSSPTIIDSIYDSTYTVQNLTPGTTYFWKVLAKNIAGDSLWGSEIFGFFVDYDATEIEQIPNNKIQSFQLYTNYPNPFNPSTTIKYDLPEQTNVNLAVYDLSGRLLQTLVNKKQTAGSHKAFFNAEGLSSGVYFYSLKAGQHRETKKMLLVR